MINRAHIDSLNRHSVLDAVVEARRGSDRCEADLLMLAAHFADLHPVPDGGVRAGHGDPTLRISNGVIGGDLGGGLGGERCGPLAGDGTPEVAEFAPEELAAALAVTVDAAKKLIGDALELRHRLPRLWALSWTGTSRPGKPAPSQQRPPPYPVRQPGSWTATSPSPLNATRSPDPDS